MVRESTEQGCRVAVPFPILRDTEDRLVLAGIEIEMTPGVTYFFSFFSSNSYK